MVSKLSIIIKVFSALLHLPVLSVANGIDVWIVNAVGFSKEGGEGGNIRVDQMGSVELPNEGNYCIGQPSDQKQTDADN